MCAAIFLAIVLLVLTVTNLRHEVSELRDDRGFADKLSALNLPLQFISEEPECSNRLLGAMGIQNVRVRTVAVGRCAE